MTGRALVRTWVLGFAGSAVLATCWVMASPPGSGPDENAHVIRAVSVAKGQLVGPRDPEIGGGATVVRAPLVLDELRAVAGCFVFRSDVPASCSPEFAGPRRDAQISTRAGLAPPLYYALTGAPLRAFPSSRGLYLARMVGAAVSSALLATAITVAAAARSPLLIAGTVVAWTPTAMFLTGVLNPSALELSAAALLWVVVASIAGRHPRVPPSRLAAAALGLSASVYALTRQLSPLWVVLTAACCVPLFSRQHLCALLRDRAMRAALASAAVVGALATTWLLAFRPLEAPHSPGGPPQSTVDTVATSIGRLGALYRQAIGMFGWLDTPAPNLVIWIWTALLGSLLLLGVVLSSRRWRLALFVTGAVAVAIPPLIEASQAPTAGLVWQGRYTLPLAMGLPILAGRAVDLHARSAPDMAKVGRALVVLAVAAHALSYVVALRRYAVGINGPVWFFGASEWQPPVPMGALLVVPALAALLVSIGLVGLIDSTQHPGTSFDGGPRRQRSDR